MIGNPLYTRCSNTGMAWIFSTSCGNVALGLVHPCVWNTLPISAPGFWKACSWNTLLFLTTFGAHLRIVVMPRANRAFSDNTVYEIIPRTRECLPMPPNQTSNELKLGILGRTQRDSKVELSHFLDMNNHSHTLAVSNHCEKQNKFYMELQKKTTDAVKALLGLKSLSLWEDRPSVAKVATLDDAIKRIVYIYCNPSKASLCDSIEEYPGINSWSAFLQCEPRVDAEVVVDARWYPVSEIPKLPSRLLSPKQDARIHQELASSEKALSHPIIIKPFKWLEAFGIVNPYKIERIRQKIIAQVRETERVNAEARLAAGKRSVPRSVLVREPYMKPHTPKKKERKIYLICGDRELRLELLERFRQIFDRCRECYRKAKEGLRVEWPPGTFTPWFPPGFTFPVPVAA